MEVEEYLHRSRLFRRLRTDRTDKVSSNMALASWKMDSLGTARGAVSTWSVVFSLGLQAGRFALADLDERVVERYPALTTAIGTREQPRLSSEPDLNPIEQVFAKLKGLLRKAEERTVEAVWRRIGSLLNCFEPTECANYLRNSGYASI